MTIESGHDKHITLEVGRRNNWTLVSSILWYQSKATGTGAIRFATPNFGVPIKVLRRPVQREAPTTNHPVMKLLLHLQGSRQRIQRRVLQSFSIARRRFASAVLSATEYPAMTVWFWSSCLSSLPLNERRARRDAKEQTGMPSRRQQSWP